MLWYGNGNGDADANVTKHFSGSSVQRYGAIMMMVLVGSATIAFCVPAGGAPASMSERQTQ